MKRMICAAALAAALVTGVGGEAMAHKITVTTPSGEVVRDKEPLAAGITPAHKTKDGSAASQGTNTACEAIPGHAAAYISGGSCHLD
jgi:hypothetical protein